MLMANSNGSSGYGGGLVRARRTSMMTIILSPSGKAKRSVIPDSSTSRLIGSAWSEPRSDEGSRIRARPRTKTATRFMGALLPREHEPHERPRRRRSLPGDGLAGRRQDHVGGLLPDHVDRGHDEEARDPGKDRGVHHPQPLRAVHLEVAVQHPVLLAGADRAGAGGVVAP